MDKVILHSDLNCFYASVEMMLDPTLRQGPMAVCGSTEDRHGIVLAKSQTAKAAGVKTGMVNWEARQRCPGLTLVPPHYEQYAKYSRLVRAIYERFTDRVEAFGMDECWLDVSGSTGLYGSGAEIAQRIRRSVRQELGLTVSIGVSFNKVFAKLGSDQSRPDSVTVLDRENYRRIVWPLPLSDLLFCGRSTTRRLARCGLFTIGDLAAASPELLRRLLGKNGERLWLFANGEDHSAVAHKDFVSPIKSLGHGVTCAADLRDGEEVWRVLLYLTQDLGRRLRVHELCAGGVQLTVKNSQRLCRQYQKPLIAPSQSPLELGRAARELFAERYDWGLPVRAVTVRAIDLCSVHAEREGSLFEDEARRERQQRLDDTVEELRRRFGRRAILPALLLDDLKLPATDHETLLPGTH